LGDGLALAVSLFGKAKKTAGLPQRLEFWEETSKKDSKGSSEDFPFAAVQYILGNWRMRKRKSGANHGICVKSPIFEACGGAGQV
jgi:hypothetical protein